MFCLKAHSLPLINVASSSFPLLMLFSLRLPTLHARDVCVQISPLFALGCALTLQGLFFSPILSTFNPSSTQWLQSGGGLRGWKASGRGLYSVLASYWLATEGLSDRNDTRSAIGRPGMCTTAHPQGTSET